jgi:hypothetical protein
MLTRPSLPACETGVVPGLSNEVYFCTSLKQQIENRSVLFAPPTTRLCAILVCHITMSPSLQQSAPSGALPALAAPSAACPHVGLPSSGRPAC